MRRKWQAKRGVSFPQNAPSLTPDYDHSPPGDTVSVQRVAIGPSSLSIAPSIPFLKRTFFIFDDSPPSPILDGGTGTCPQAAHTKPITSTPKSNGRGYVPPHREDLVSRAPVPVFRARHLAAAPRSEGKDSGSPTLTQVQPNNVHSTTLEMLFKRSPLVPREIAVAKKEAAAALALEEQAKKAVEGKDALGRSDVSFVAPKNRNSRGPISYKFIHREVERQKLFNSVSLSDGERELMTRQFLAGVHHGDIKVCVAPCILDMAGVNDTYQQM